tara:strand:+ start:3300 stop:3908 length:609 start_codon:yes stop_codon:yes gene_type:complete
MNPLFPALMASAFILSASGELMPTSAEVFGGKYASLDNRATSDWWTRQGPQRKNRKAMINLDVPRDKVIGFAIYTLEGSSLKMTAQLFPLKPDESQEIRLELKKGDTWKEIAKQKIIYPGWPLTFNFNDNDGRKATGHLEYNVDFQYPVVQIINERTDEILYTKRVKKSKGKLLVYSTDPHTIKIGKDKPVLVFKTGLTAKN